MATQTDPSIKDIILDSPRHRMASEPQSPIPKTEFRQKAAERDPKERRGADHARKPPNSGCRQSYWTGLATATGNGDGDGDGDGNHPACCVLIQSPEAIHRQQPRSAKS